MGAETLPVIVRDLSFPDDALGTRVDGMIVFDFLKQGPFTIDYASKRIIMFGPIDSSLAGVPYETHLGYALIELKVQQQSLRLPVDTGVSELVLFASATHDCQDAMKSVETQTWPNIGGEIRMQQAQFKNAYLRPMPWGTQDVFILPEGSTPPAGLSGLLGLASLRARPVGFDTEHRIIGWDQESGPEQVAKTVR